MLLASPKALPSRSSLAFYLAAGVLLLVGALLFGTIHIEPVQADDEIHAAAQVGKAAQSREQPAAAKTERTEPLHYTGIIVDEDTGKGIPNATVVVRRFKFKS